MSLADLPDTRAASAPDQPCIDDDTGALTNAAFARRVTRAAAALAASGVGRGDVVAVKLPNRVELIIVVFAAWRLGAVVTPINPALGDTETTFQLTDSDSVVIVADPDAEPEAHWATPVVPVASLAAEGGAAALPGSPDDIALVIYTSGTTGTPKGVMLSHANLDAMTSSFIEWFSLTPADHSLLVLPLFHANGIVLGTLSPLRAGGRVTITGRFSRDRFFSDVEKHRPTYFSAVPAIYALLSALPEDVRPDTSSLRFAVCGAAPIPAELLRRFEQRFGFTVVEGYGLSETTTASTINPLDGVRKPGTVGLPLPGQRVAIHDPDGSPVPAGETGEVVISGPVVMVGYLNRPDATAEAIVDGWLRTGDIGRFDEDGYLQIVDRLKDMIIRGGENVYPKEIENALYAHEDVLEVAVIGRRDGVMGEVPVAYVTMRTKGSATADELLRLCSKSLAAYKRPVEVTFIDEIPKNAVGKIDKRVLRKLDESAGATPAS